MDKRPRMRLVTALLLLVVFGSGLTIGLAVDRDRAAGPVDDPPTEETDATQERRVPMWEQVGPNETQKASIDSIVRDHRGAMKSLHREFNEAYSPRYQALVAETREAIKSVFDPDQRVVYDSLLVDWDRRREEDRERRDNDQD